MRVWSVEPLNGDVAQLVQCREGVFSHGSFSAQTILKTWCSCRPSVQLHGQTSVRTLKTQALAAVHCTIASRRLPLPNSRPAVFFPLYCYVPPP